ncbi:MAG TPA: hypothetical protein VIU62_16420 [Chloroflexota bacterium]
MPLNQSGAALADLFGPLLCSTGMPASAWLLAGANVAGLLGVSVPLSATSVTGAA